MIPAVDAFGFFQDLAPLVVVVAALLALARAPALRRTVFVLTGTYLLFLIAPRLALFYLGLWLLVAATQPLVAATGEKRMGPAVLTFALALPLLPLLLWKLWPIWFVTSMNVRLNRLLRVLPDPLAAIDFTADIVGPVGLSFAAFRAADLLVKSNLGIVGRLSVGSTMAYGLFPPLLVVGPVATYDEVSRTLDQRVPLDRERVIDGALHVIAGLTKLWVLAAPLAWSVSMFADAEVNSAPRLWVAFVAYGWYFYLNFAGYSDLAIGLGRFLGADIRENFNRPYFQTNPTDFWNRWHISLTRFVRANVFTPITMARPGRQEAGLMITMVIIGLWHVISPAALVFGLYHGASLVAHRRLVRRRPAASDPAPLLRIAKSVGVFVWFVASLPLIELSIGETLDFYRALVFGGGGEVT